MVGTMSTLDRTGDTRLMWNSDNPDEVEAARAHFNSLTKRRSEGGKGYLAYKATGKDGKKGEQIREFDPEAERIIMVPPSAGG